MKRLLMFTATALVLAVPLVASAQDGGQYGYTTGEVSLFSGPGGDYPSVMGIPEGTELQIEGCTEGWEWCDVIVGDGDDRGWIPGNYIEYDYQDQPVLVSEYGARVGVPIVSFSIGNYWDRYYRYRPFYHDRARWYGRPYYRRAAPRPFEGWSLRFGINGRDHHDWNHHHNNWDRDHYYNHDHDHGRVVPLPHPIYDNHRWHGAQTHSSYPARVDAPRPRPVQNVAPRNPQPRHVAPNNGDHKGKPAKPDDQKDKNDKVRVP